MGHRRVGSGPESVVLEDIMKLAIASHLMTAQAGKDPVRPESRHVHEYTQRSPDERWEDYYANELVRHFSPD